MAHDDSDEGIKNLIKFFKKIKWAYIILVMVMLFGIYLRFYHINYPTIGYHNMKEDHYLSLALNMRESGNYLRTTWYDCSGYFINDYFGDPQKMCSANSSESPPAVWMLILFFTIFGWKLWVARLFIILACVLTVIPIYLIIKKLSNNEYLALLSSFIYVVLPLSIFVGRNIQMDAPSLLFSLLTLYFLIKFVYDNKTKDFIIASIFFVLAAWFKPITLMVLAALIFIIPLSTYKRYITKIKDYKIEIIVLVIAIMLSVIWPLYLAGVVMPEAKNVGAAGVDLSKGFFGKSGWIDTSFSIFGSEYWTNYKTIIFSYISDNYSWTGFWLIIIGFALFCLNYRSKLSRFMFGYALGIAIYIPLFAYKWNAHMYYQYPFLMFAAMCIANIFVQAGALLRSFFKNGNVKRIVQLVPLIALILLIAPFKESAARMFNTQFFGQDIAGTYINTHLTESEIFLLERGIQNQMSWTARRFYYSVPDDAEIIKRLEKEKNLKYIAMTYSGITTIQQKKSWPYITENYHIAQIGFVQTQQGPQVYHIVLEKGGTFNTSSLDNRPARLAETYEMTYTEVPYYVIEV
jgi:4-amino-4-deoxy-L-arabinose transferase-like glycosyltransferase